MIFNEVNTEASDIFRKVEVRMLDEKSKSIQNKTSFSTISSTASSTPNTSHPDTTSSLRTDQEGDLIEGVVEDGSGGDGGKVEEYDTFSNVYQQSVQNEELNQNLNEKAYVRYGEMDDYEVSKLMQKSSFLQCFSDVTFDLFQENNSGFDVDGFDHSDLNFSNNDQRLGSLSNGRHHQDKDSSLSKSGSFQQNKSNSILDREFRKNASSKLLTRIVQYSLRPDAVTVTSPSTRQRSSSSGGGDSLLQDEDEAVHGGGNRSESPHGPISKRYGFDSRKDGNHHHHHHHPALMDGRLKQTVWVLSEHMKVLRAHTERPVTASPVVAYVYIARWPATGPLHFDFELEHSGFYSFF
jgi:hypothetical protein